MRMYDIITEKKHGRALSDEEIRFFIDGFTRGEIPDYQASALLMAICLRDMNDHETFVLTDAIAKSGDSVDLSVLGERTVDKHSTGGVGDKMTPIVAPIAAAAGAVVAKMSGRGLGHTGGTVDKLESFRGYRTSLSTEEFFETVRKCGIAVVGQSGDLAPADKKLYALRDVTATVDSIPLIASSIMGKKLAAGSKSIVLDVKCGSGSFMKTPEDATRLAEKMVAIGKRAGRRVAALITDMDCPLGHAVGNALEIREALDVLHGGGPEDLRTVAIALSSAMVHLALGLSREKAESLCKEILADGRALAKCREWIAAQGGDPAFCDHPERLPRATYALPVLADRAGYLSHADAESIGIASVALGAGRRTKEDAISYGAGILLGKKTGERVAVGDCLATLYTDKKESFEEAEAIFRGALTFSEKEPKKQTLIYKTITSEEE